MTETGSDTDIDYAAVFQALPGPTALLTRDLVFADANDAFLRQARRDRADVVGRYLFDVFPENPYDRTDSGVTSLQKSLDRVFTTGQVDPMALVRYDTESPDRPGRWEERYWSPVNAPVPGPDGRPRLLIHRVEEVTDLIRAIGRRDGEHHLEVELYTRVQELQEVNERLRTAHDREREVALALQQAMLPAPDHIGRHQAAVRYRPATGALNVCGDWYDLVRLSAEDMVAVSVGDVVGHGLEAAGVMGQLRSALSATSRVATGPAQALDILGRYAHSVEGAESTTVVTAFIDWARHLVTYSSAGHPPPILVHDGGAELLDRATDPPLDADPAPGPRPEASVPFADGDTLVLYTDGLIERRHQDIDVGLGQLVASVRRRRERMADPDELADAVLRDLLPERGLTDDTALVVFCL